MDALEFLNFAKQLSSPSPLSEVNARVIAGRSYYAVYHKSNALDLCLANHGGIKQGGTHAFRCTKFSEYPMNNSEQFPPDIVRNIKSIGHSLNILRSERCEAEYNLDILYSEQQAKTVIKNTEILLERIDILLEKINEITPQSAKGI